MLPVRLRWRWWRRRWRCCVGGAATTRDGGDGGDYTHTRVRLTDGNDGWCVDASFLSVSMMMVIVRRRSRRRRCRATRAVQVRRSGHRERLCDTIAPAPVTGDRYTRVRSRCRRRRRQRVPSVRPFAMWLR